MKNKQKYQEGDWFYLPLRRGNSYAIGLVARKARRGITLGYFWGPFKEPNKVRLEDLNPNNAVTIQQFGDLGLLNGEWKVLGGTELWNRAAWNVPVFRRIDAITDLPLDIRYSEDLVELEAYPATKPKTPSFEDGLFGYGATEIALTKLMVG